MFEIFVLYSCLLSMLVLFHLFVVFGARVGKFDYGGFVIGKLPVGIRIFSGLYILILLASEFFVLSKMEYILFGYEQIVNTVMLGMSLFFAVVMLFHMVVKNSWNRQIWAPINLVLMTASIMIYFTK